MQIYQQNLNKMFELIKRNEKGKNILQNRSSLKIWHTYLHDKIVVLKTNQKIKIFFERKIMKYYKPEFKL